MLDDLMVKTLTADFYKYLKGLIQSIKEYIVITRLVHSF